MEEQTQAAVETVVETKSPVPQTDNCELGNCDFNEVEYTRPVPEERLKRRIAKVTKTIERDQKLLIKLQEFLANEELMKFVEEHQEVLDTIF